MRVVFPDLYAANEALRYVYRANHVYVLFASLVNLALAVRVAGGDVGWRAKLATAGSLLALASPAVLCLAFVLEAPEVRARSHSDVARRVRCSAWRRGARGQRRRRALVQ